MSNLTVENVYTRHKAKELTKKHFWKLLGMMLIVGVIVYGIMAAGMALLSLIPGTMVTTETTITSASASINGSGAAYTLGYLAMMLVIMLVSGGLSLGLTSAMIDLCRGDETVTVGRVFSRMGQCLKALGLSLWMYLKMLAWALPVYVIVGFAGFGIAVAGDPVAAQANETTTAILTILPFVAMILVFALVIPAAFRYMLSTYILADEGDRGIRECVNLSKAMMKGHKWQAFKLAVPLFLILYAVIFGMALVFGFLMAFLTDAVPALAVVFSIVMIVAIIAVAMFFALHITLAYCLFYLKRKEEQNPAPEAPVETIAVEAAPEATEAE